MTIYAKLYSWHQLEIEAPAATGGDTSSALVALTRCGREVPGDAPTSPTLPLGEPSCETCLRLVRHDEEATGTDGEGVE
jgi:hypothetical protein